MRIFLTGASGYIGSALVPALQGEGYELTGLARSDEAAQRIGAAGCAVRRGEIGEPSGWTAALEDADVVIHTAVGSGGRVGEADLAAAAAIVDALAPPRGSFILTSGLGVYFGVTAPILAEDTPLDEAIPAQQPRIALERQVLAAAGRGVRAVVLRPGHVYGDGRCGVFTAMQLDHARRSGLAAYVGDGSGLYSAVHRHDLVAAYLAALERAPAGGCYNVVGSVHPMLDVAGAVSRAVGAGGTASLTTEQAGDAFGPLASGLAGTPPVSGLRAAVELGWSARRPSLLHELTHGTLRGSG